MSASGGKGGKGILRRFMATLNPASELAKEINQAEGHTQNIEDVLEGRSEPGIVTASGEPARDLLPVVDESWLSSGSGGFGNFYPTYGGIARNSAFPFKTQGLNWFYPSMPDDAIAPVAPADPLVDPYDAIRLQISNLRQAEPKVVAKPMPDYLQTITAWRGWNLDNGLLSALGQDHVWKPREVVAATCCSYSGGHAAPSKDCTCGYWSFKSLDVLVEALKSYQDDLVVLGSVSIWGRTIECENGWRSEYAYPQELWLLNPGLEYLSWKYGVPVRAMAEGAQAEQDKDDAGGEEAG